MLRCSLSVFSSSPQISDCAQIKEACRNILIQVVIILSLVPVVATIWQIFRNEIAQCCVFLGMWYFQVGHMKNVSPMEFPSLWSIGVCCFCSPITEKVKVQFYPLLSFCPLLQSGTHLQSGGIALEQALIYHRCGVQSPYRLCKKICFYQLLPETSPCDHGDLI